MNKLKEFFLIIFLSITAASLGGLMGWFGVQKFFASDDKAPVVSKTIPKADYSFKPTGDKLLDDCIKTVMPAYNYSGGSASYSQTKRACERSIRTGGRY